MQGRTREVMTIMDESALNLFDSAGESKREKGRRKRNGDYDDTRGISCRNRLNGGG